MDGMIETVAKAMFTAEQPIGAPWNEFRWTHTAANYRLLARAAIAAMRDCSQGMRIAGRAALDASDASESAIGSKIGYAALGDAWRAMIDDALSRS